MATFYKYKERDDISKSMIDWSGLTKNISDNLMAEKNKRDQLKQELEEDQLNKIKAVEEFTQGLDPSMNQAMIKVSQQYKDYLLTRHRLMKQGLVSVNDTKLKKQGAIDTFDSINNAAKDYNVKMAKYIETGGNLNDFAVQDTAEILNIADSQLVIDDMGRGTFIKVDENGNEIAMPANSFATIMDDVFDRFDDDLEFTKATKDLAKIQIASSGYFNVTDFRQDTELYNEWLTNKTKEILNTDKRVAEVAADLLGIEATRDKEEAKEKGLVLFEYKNGKRSVNVDYVRDKVKKAVENGLNSRLDRIEERTPYRPTAAEISGRAGEEADKEVSSLIEKFVVNADFSALKSALAQKGFQGSTAPDEDGIIRLIDPNGKSFEVETKGKDAKQVGQEIAGPLKVGQYFKDRNITANLNTGVIDGKNKSKYGIFVSAPTQNFDTVENREYVYDKLQDTFGPLTGEERSQEIAQRMQNIVGNKADITYKGDDVIINGTTVVANGLNNASRVFSAIDNISTKQEPTINLNASKRKE